MILITGATGTIGKETIKQLAGGHARVRALVRDRDKGAKLGVEFVVGDLANPVTLARAFSGVEKVLVIAPPGEALAELEGNAFDAAKNAGVRHIVKVSARGIDQLAGTALAGLHAQSERRLRALGIPWTILRPGPFTNSVVVVWGLLTRGVLFLPTGEGRDAPIDPRDVAAVAVKVLTSPGAMKARRMS